jgi:hypothetical protein
LYQPSLQGWADEASRPASKADGTVDSQLVRRRIFDVRRSRGEELLNQRSEEARHLAESFC